MTGERRGQAAKGRQGIKRATAVEKSKIHNVCCWAGPAAENSREESPRSADAKLTERRGLTETCAHAAVYAR